ncbi:MAG TPA: alpha/beta fold hydrolase [Gordonia sp. (in: high G+C Gram-positive bacteria)]|uniref:alpha/beta fold hydrolase n=1 Tax=Gordonia sp. (in: high G+C Gram-positive bacteria) TaxID=84139 RepID=UPI002623EADF|nr:alpha/beta fold hydrolase [Gordonia sp. (in: high G+C Gram-positive bacteria)]HNP57107.1 alpha/beta fold hydrolase [Gordonia sp. (in: high G+C Gram-positive bacteria)]HRC50573.1 alpha/beta fold hydrolase [Gordonia sp. (in: high G+C Gram-positive bacteria)]
MASDIPNRTEFELDDLTVAALTWGDPSAPLALCLHGYPDTAWTWRHLGPVLAEHGYYVVAPFSRGYAPTSVPADGDLTVGARIADALAIAERVGAPRSVIVGHDWGAFTAHGAAALPDSPFDAHVALAIPPLASIRITRQEFARQVWTAVAQTRNSWYIVVNQLPRLPERVFASMTGLLWREWAPGYDAAVDLAHLAEAAPPRNRAAIVGYYRQMVRPRPGSALTRELTKLFMAPPIHPVQVLYGSDDHAMRAQFFAGLDDGRLPEGSRVERLEGLGHFLHLERPEQVNALIVDHLGPA